MRFMIMLGQNKLIWLILKKTENKSDIKIL